LASDKPEPGTPLARAVGQYPFQQGEAPLEAPMFSPDDLIGTGIGKAAIVGGSKLAPLLMGMVKNPKNETILYHVTNAENLPNIIQKGIQPNKVEGFTKGVSGKTLSDKGKVYAFDNYNDALRWQTKMDWDVNDPNLSHHIVPFIDDASKYVKDIHPEYSNYLGVLKKEGGIKPEQLLEVNYTKPIDKISAGEKTGEYSVDELNQFKNAIPYLPEARLFSRERFFNPYATKYNTELNPVETFWNTQGLSQRPLNPKDYGIEIKNKLADILKQQ
jgi:hypothetical protein